MLENLLITINDFIQDEFWLSMLGCFAWGIVSTLLSPCHLASIPLLVCYVAGQPVSTKPRRAAGYAVCFSGGLFAAVFCVGGVCAAAGRMLGDVPGFVYALTGLVLLAAGLRTMLVMRSCNMDYSRLFRWNFTGFGGAFLMGLLYGLLAGACTFGFLAPMLGVIFLEGKMALGVVMIVVFGLGHCLPIVLAGCGIGVLETKNYARFGPPARRIAGALVAIFGACFIAQGFFRPGFW